MLGLLLVAGTVAGSLAVRPGSGYLIVPAPAPAYLAGALIVGLIHDRATDTSRTALALSAVQWIASGFVAMSIATILAVTIAIVRWTRMKSAPPVQGVSTDRQSVSRSSR